MSLTIWDPFFNGMETAFDRFARPRGRGEFDWQPTVDIEEDDKNFLVKAELPGVKKSDVNVSVENGLLTIKGEKKVEEEDKKRHRVECAYGSFVRSFTLPKTVSADKVEAKYADGVLNLIIPKSEEVIPKAIEVKVR